MTGKTLAEVVAQAAERVLGGRQLDLVKLAEVGDLPCGRPLGQRECSAKQSSNLPVSSLSALSGLAAGDKAGI